MPNSLGGASSIVWRDNCFQVAFCGCEKVVASCRQNVSTPVDDDSICSILVALRGTFCFCRHEQRDLFTIDFSSRSPLVVVVQAMFVPHTGQEISADVASQVRNTKQVCGELSEFNMCQERERRRVIDVKHHARTCMQAVSL